MNYSYKASRQYTKVSKLILLISTVLVFVISLAGMCWAIYTTTTNSDWEIFASASRTLDPFSVPGYFNPVFALPFIVPFGILPFKIGGALWSVVNIVAVVWCVDQLCDDTKNRNLVRLTATLVSIPVISYVDMAQIGVIALVGATLLERNINNPLGVLMVMAKPQLFSAQLIIWFKNSGSLSKTIVVIAVIISLFVYGLWPIDMVYGVFNEMGYETQHNNIAQFTWPYNPLIGLVILIYGIKKDSLFITAMATPFFMPYFNNYSLLPLFAYFNAKMNFRVVIVTYIIVTSFFLISYFA